MGDVLSCRVPVVEAVVAGLQVMIGIQVVDRFLDLLPILQGLRRREVVLVGEAPPDVRVGRKALHQVGQVDQVVLLRHGGKAPAVIGVEQDKIHLNAHAAKRCDLLLKGIPEAAVRMGHIPAAILPLCEREERGIVLVVAVILREDAHADFVKRRLFQRLHGLCHEVLCLVGKGVDRGPEGIEGRPVLVFEVGADRLHHAVACRLLCNKASLCLDLSCHLVGIGSCLLRIKADLVGAVSRIEAGNGLLHAVLCKGSCDFGISRCSFWLRSPKRKLCHLVLSHWSAVPFLYVF